MDSKSIRRAFSKAGFVTLIALFCRELIGGVWSLVLFPDGEDPFFMTLLPMLITYIITIPLVWLVIRKASTKEQLPDKRPIPFGTLAMWFLACFGISRLLMVTTSMIQTAIIGDTYVDPVTTLQQQSPWMMFFLAAFLAPVAEELIFRGFLYKALAPYGGKWFILTSALLFALFHVNLTQIPFAFVLGLFLAFVMYRTGNVLIPILLHFITNFVSSLSVLFMGSEIGTTVAVSIFMVLTLTGVVISIILLAKGRFKRDLVLGPAKLVPARASQALINVGVLITIFITVALTAIILAADLLA